MTYKYEEEGHARDLHRALSEEFANSAPETEVSVKGFGVHWDCTARRGERLRSVACFATWGPEYLVSFENDARRETIGRTASRAEAIAAVGDWLDGHRIEDLYKRFDFVDGQERALTAIEAEVVEFDPELGQRASSDIREIIWDSFELWFKAQDRSCRVSYYGRNQLPVAVFHWDECELLHIQTGDTVRLAAMLKRWLCDQAMPSEMAADFSGAEVKPVARYYEEGRPVEGEFITSWYRIEQFYEDARFPFAEQVLGMIGRIRQAGYDKTLRAGQSLWSLVVSRSRRHGLREGQPSITFWFSGNGMDVYASMNGQEKLTFSRIEFSPQIDDLLRRLTSRDID
jgi:hypothetical protein